MNAADAPAPGLIERRAELDLIGGALEQARDGSGAVLLITGQAGIGKTQLLRAGARAAARHGFHVCAARAGELERDFSYGVVRQLFEHVVVDADAQRRRELLTGAAELARPALGLGGEVTDLTVDSSFPVIHGLLWLALNLAAERPLLIQVDDLQWADAPSARFLEYLSGRIEGPVVVCVAARTGVLDDDDRTLSVLRSLPAARELELHALSREGVATLAQRLIGRPLAPAAVAACHEATGGNPFYASELLRAVARHGAQLELGDESLREAVGGAFSAALAVRLAGLPESCAGLTRAVAVLGASANLAHAADLAGLGTDLASEASMILEDDGILVGGHSLSFAHPILREAAYADIAPLERAGLHGRAARLLADSDVPPEQYAPHLLASEPSGDGWVVEGLRDAARHALEQGAPDLARRYLERALSEPVGADERPEVLGALGTASWRMGDSQNARRLLAEAIESSRDGDRRAVHALALSRAMLFSGDVTGAFALLEGELEHFGGARTDATERLESELCAVGLSAAETVDGAISRIDAGRPGERSALQAARGDANRSVLEYLRGSAPTAAQLAEAALDRGLSVTTEGPESVGLMELAWCLAAAEREEPARELAGELLEAAARRGSTFGHVAGHALLAVIAMTSGDLLRGEEEARASLELGEPPPFLRPAILAVLGYCLALGGDADGAAEALADAEAGGDLPATIPSNLVWSARGTLHLTQGRYDDALEAFEGLAARQLRCRDANPAFGAHHGACTSAIGLGDRSTAYEHATALGTAAQRWATPGAIGLAEHAKGLIAGHDGLGHLARAVEVLGESRARLSHATALIDYGSALRRGGRRAQARDPLRRGRELAQRLGAVVLARRAEDELSTAGAKPKRLMFSGEEALTASERRVASLAGAGKSNREIAQQLFITVKTVENHLSRVYAKLDISSRTELQGAIDGPGAEYT